MKYSSLLTSIPRCFVVSIACFLAGSPALAVLVAYDPFLTAEDPNAAVRGDGEYSFGVDVRTQGAAALGWVGSSGIDGFGVPHTGSTSNFQPNALGEDSGAVEYESATGRLQWLGVGNFAFDRNITRQLNPIPSSSEWWFTIMVNRLAWADSPDNTYAVGGFTDGSGNGLQVGYDDTAGNNIPDLVLRTNGQNIVLAADVASSDNQFVITQLIVNETGNDTINVWVDPTAVNTPGFETSPDFSITDQNVTESLTPFAQSKYESPGQSGVVYFDEIRLGTEFVTVVEPPAVPVLRGDFNADDTVDLADYTLWRNNFGAPDESGINNAGDGLNGVDIVDYDLWRGNFGQSAAVLASSAVSVPEPSTIVLLLSLTAVFAASRLR